MEDKRDSSVVDGTAAVVPSQFELAIERMKALTARVVAVPKAEVEKRAKAWAKERKQAARATAAKKRRMG